ncbi:MAG: MFS transporter [Alphaproteobacteria bacterium]
MTREKRNVLVLATCQVLFGTGRSLLIVTAPLIAYSIASHKGLATLPTSLVIVGTAIMTIPASLFMRRVGRKVGFILGSLIGVVSGLVSAYAVLHSDFWLFAFGALLFGFFAGFAQLYRFAAADVASEDFKSKAISLVLAGGVVSGFLGPESAKIGQHMVTSVPFVGAYLILTGVTVLAIFVLLLLDIPKLTPQERAGPRRPMMQIMKQPVFLVAATAAMISQGVMNFLMTATPIAMAHAHHQFSDTALVIEWHIFGMFAPGFVTGHLINKFGETKMIITGLTLQFFCVGVALIGVEVAHFWLSMLLLGIGWNFAFTAGTSLMTTAYTVSERAKTQGAMNFLIYGFVSVLSLSSGALVHFFGWDIVNLGAIPFLALAVGTTLWYAIHQNRSTAVST